MNAEPSYGNCAVAARCGRPVWRRIFDLVSIICLLLVALAGPIHAAEPQDPGRAQLDEIFPQSTLRIATPDARLHRFKIWIAADDARRARGLMYVKQLKDDEGMLFLYEEPRPIGMWMKNTFIPLDMIFIDRDGRIRHIAENTEPQSLKTIESTVPVVAVLELKGGTAKRLRLSKAARVLLDELLNGEHAAQR